RPFNKVTLSRLLRRPQYAGLVPHRGKLYPGQHAAIVAEAVWSRAQSLLRHNGATGGKGPRNRHGALLRGLIRCGHCDCSMTHSFTRKRNRPYRYYVGVNRLKKGAHACPDGKVAAAEVERQVVDRIREIGRDPELVARAVEQARAQLEVHRRVLECE